ncbi:MAG: hypothetical protein QM783_05035 [Phycisphaerales bacterium]
MSRVQRELILMLLITATVAVGARVLAWRSAAAAFDVAAAGRATVAEKAARIASLRSLPAVNGFGTRPGEDVMSLATRVLDSAHVPAARLRSVQPEADRVVVDDRDGRRAATVRLSLEPLTVPELGAFLAAWRSSQQVWSVSRIDMNAVPPGGGAAAGSYRASITVSATYLDDPAPSSSTPSTGPVTPAPTPTTTATAPLVGQSQ